MGPFGWDSQKEVTLELRPELGASRVEIWKKMTAKVGVCVGDRSVEVLVWESSGCGWYVKP